MASLFRRSPRDTAGSSTSTDPVVASESTSPASTTPARNGQAPTVSGRPVRSYTPKKGEPTPRRTVTGRRPAAPVDPKEAAALARAKQRESRAQSRAGMLAGDERYLLPKDKGPVRRLARDVVDSRHNVATFFFFSLFGVLLLANKAFPVVVQYAANGVFLFMLLATLADVVLLVRRIKRLGAERLPKVTDGYRGLYFYVLMRSISVRRLRIPKPQVKTGDKV